MFNFKLLHSAVHNIAFFSEKVVSSESVEKHAQIKYHLQAKIIQNCTKISEFGLRGQGINSSMERKQYYGL